jgi:death-on-curing protein
MLHDEGIALSWPGIEPVFRNECIDLGRLYASVAQPFQAAFGVEFYPTIQAKAACLFYGLIENHCFHNGNKRTAVLAIDQFLLANRYILLITNEEIRQLAEDTASHRARRVSAEDMRAQITDMVETNSLALRGIRAEFPPDYRRFLREAKSIREHPRNQPGVRPHQEIRQRWRRGE